MKYKVFNSSRKIKGHTLYGMATTRRTFLGVATALTASICLAAGAVRAERTWKIPEGFQWGVTFGFYATNGYFSSSVAKDEIEAIARAGATWVTVVPTVWQDEGASAFQYKDFAHTPNDIELMDAIDLIHAKGMKVQLRPMLECKDGYGRQGVWMNKDLGRRMTGRVSDGRTRWFASMRERSVYYARIAERTKCELFCLDSELDKMVEENAKWKSVVAAVRGVYSGPVTSCHTLHTSHVDYLAFLANKDHWFYDLDFLSFSYYCPARRKDETGKALTVDDMVKNLAGAHARTKAIADAMGRPIIFGECGCSSTQDGAKSPSRILTVVDEDEQANYMEALFRVFAHEPWCRGFHWWKWDQNSPTKPDSTREGTLARDFTFRGKKAEAVFRHWVRR